MEVILPVLLHLEGTASIATKYAYYTLEDYEAVTNRFWTNEMTQRRMLLAGWTAPGNYDGLLKNMFEEVTKDALVDVYRYTEVADKKVREVLNVQARALNHEEVHENEDPDSLPAAAVMYGLIRSAFVHEASDVSPKVMVCGLVITFAPATLRYLCVAAAFGDSHVGKGIASCCLLTFFFLHFILLSWALVIVKDNARRNRAYKMLGQLIVKPGVPLKEFLNVTGGEEEKEKEKEVGKGKSAKIAPESDANKGDAKKNANPWTMFFKTANGDGKEEEGEGEEKTDKPGPPVPDVEAPSPSQIDKETLEMHIYINPNSIKDIQTWGMCRNIVRVYGQSFMLCGEGYLSINLVSTILILLIMNILVVGALSIIFGIKSI
ncbi:hypothetical protein TL16_g07343 [Triparma laevis f. inornata]|uniref:Uncharacterized protein n=1 Tax=Triparma laevis f. inornata TaxID=1714386 RepID=A0A9W7AXD4_9STRA|nr:hypothetical protein TL16_g07343 [Triparma laevis f. inornata]